MRISGKTFPWFSNLASSHPSPKGGGGSRAFPGSVDLSPSGRPVLQRALAVIIVQVLVLRACFHIRIHPNSLMFVTIKLLAWLSQSRYTFCATKGKFFSRAGHDLLSCRSSRNAALKLSAPFPVQNFRVACRVGRHIQVPFRRSMAEPLLDQAKK